MDALKTTAIELARTGSRVAIVNFINPAERTKEYLDLMIDESVKANNFTAATYLIAKSPRGIKDFLFMAVEYGNERILSWLLEEYAVTDIYLNEARGKAATLGNSSMVEMLSDALGLSNETTGKIDPEDAVALLVDSICDRLPETLLNTYEGTKLQKLLSYISEYLV